MEVLHITPSTDGYEVVTLLANKISKKNSLSAIIKNGEESMTGGFILNDTKEIRDILNNIPNNKQYDFVKSFRIEPFVKQYLEEQ